jgi:hypothetical protein
MIRFKSSLRTFVSSIHEKTDKGKIAVFNEGEEGVEAESNDEGNQGGLQ